MLKKLFTYCWKKIKRPFVQLICILVLLTGYWSYDIMLVEHSVQQPTPTEVEQIEYPTDSLSMKELMYSEEFYKRFVIPDSLDSVVTRKPSSVPSENPADDMSNKEFWLEVIDTVLGHLSSIIGSLAALTVPLLTWLNEKRKNNNE